MMDQFQSIISHFAISGTVSEIKPLGNGLINDTYKVTTVEADAPDYVLQRINDSIFTDVDLLIIQEELLNPFRFLHFADSYSLIEDIENSYKSNFRKKIFYSLISILFNVGLLVTIFIIILYKLYNTITILNKILTIIDKLMCNYSSNII